MKGETLRQSLHAPGKDGRHFALHGDVGAGDNLANSVIHLGFALGLRLGPGGDGGRLAQENAERGAQGIRDGRAHARVQPHADRGEHGIEHQRTVGAAGDAADVIGARADGFDKALDVDHMSTYSVARIMAAAR